MKYCNRKNNLFSNVLRADMYGGAKLNLKEIKCKTCVAQTAIFLFVIGILYFFFYGHAYELEFRFPHESQLSEAPSLRAQDGRILDPQLRALVVPFLSDQCKVMEDVDLLFCFQVKVDARPLYSPCFVDCRKKQFYYDVTVMETDEPGTIQCIETYATLELKKSRPKRIAVKGFKGMDLDEFVTVPETIVDNCLVQHASEVARGKWLKDY